MKIMPEQNTNLIKVLVVDDSAYVRKVIKKMLLSSPFIEVVGIAHDGEDALEQVAKHDPDVITLDLIMPGIDGIDFIRQQMLRKVIPIVIVSIADEGGQKVLDALDAGAVDFIHKPTALATDKIYEIQDDLIQKVKKAAKLPLNPYPPALSQATPKLPPSRELIPSTIPRFDIVLIGISTGGPQALTYLIPQFPADFPVPIAVVLHMPKGYTKLYAERLNNYSSLEVIEAHNGDAVVPGRVLIATAGYHLGFERNREGVVVAKLQSKPFDLPHRPSVDVLFQSGAQVYGDRTLGVVMTGMGSDGKQGAAQIKSHGGMIITESESSCVVYGMPRSVVEAGLSDRSISLKSIPETIYQLLFSRP